MGSQVDEGDSARARRELAEQGRTVDDLIASGMDPISAAREFARLLNNLRDTHRRNRVKALALVPAEPEPEPEPPRDPRLCGLPACDEQRAKGSAWCGRHTHDWLGMAEVPMDPRFVAGAARTNYSELREGTFVRILEVVCGDCRVGFAAGRNTPCSRDGVHLRGGPIGTRQKREADEDEAGVAGDTHPLDAVASGS